MVQGVSARTKNPLEVIAKPVRRRYVVGPARSKSRKSLYANADMGDSAISLLSVQDTPYATPGLALDAEKRVKRLF